MNRVVSGPLWYRLRFGLGTLLVAVTACAVWFGYQVHRARTQQRAITEVRHLGGQTYYETTLAHWRNEQARLPDAVDIWLSRMLGADYLADVEIVDFDDAHVEDKDLQVMRDLPRVRWLPSTRVDSVVECAPE